MLMNARRRALRPQQGLVLIIVLVVLVLMSLASAAMFRSVSTANTVIGNLAFQQAAASSGDRGMEAAVSWLNANLGKATSTSATACATGSSVLACDQAARGYASFSTDIPGQQTAAVLWSSLAVTPVSLSSDAAGNSVSYVIERLCASGYQGLDPVVGGCAATPVSSTCGQSKSLGSMVKALNCSTQFHYRITVKSTGPRNTVSYSQSVLAL